MIWQNFWKNILLEIAKKYLPSSIGRLVDQMIHTLVLPASGNASFHILEKTTEMNQFPSIAMEAPCR